MLLGEFRIDRHPDRNAAVFLAGQLDCEFDTLAGAGDGFHILCILIRRKHLFQQHPQLHFTPGAARLHIGQHTLQVADPDRQLLHLAQALMDLVKAVRYQLERLSQALLQCRMQFFIDRLAHFFQTATVVCLQILDFGFQRQSYFRHALGIGLG